MSDPRKANMIRIAIVDDHPMLREGIVHTFRREADFEVVGEGQSANDAVDIAERLLPEVMLIDINMPGGGLNALRRISETCPAIAVLVITVRDDEETVGDALRIGARGYVLKGIGGGELVRTVRAIHQGEIYITPTLAARILTAELGPMSPEREQRKRMSELNVREGQILRLIAKGKSNKQIASELDLSEKTIKHYVTNILQKLQVSNRVEAAVMAQHQKS